MGGRRRVLCSGVRIQRKQAGAAKPLALHCLGRRYPHPATTGRCHRRVPSKYKGHLVGLEEGAPQSRLVPVLLLIGPTPAGAPRRAPKWCVLAGGRGSTVITRRSPDVRAQCCCGGRYLSWPGPRMTTLSPHRSRRRRHRPNRLRGSRTAPLPKALGGRAPTSHSVRFGRAGGARARTDGYPV